MNISKNLISRNHTAKKRAKADIKYIVVHYVGALGDAKANCDYYKNNDVGASADFFVGHNGDIWQANDYYNYYSWHCGGGLQGSGGASYYKKCTNSNSVGIEMCVKKKSTKTMNATDKDWYFTSETVKAAAELVTYLMKELDVDIDHVIRHYDVNGKICPNPFVYNTGDTSWTEFKQMCSGTGTSSSAEIKYYRIRLTWADEKSQIGAYESLENAKKNCPAGYSVFDPDGKSIYTVAAGKTDKVWMGWVSRESGSKGYRCTNGDSGKAQGAFQFDYRYALVPFMQFCVDTNASHYAGFKTYIAYGAGSSKLVNNSSLAKLWESYCDNYTAEFQGLQDTYAYNHYYLEVKKYLTNLYGINLDNHSPAVKGSAFSMSIRSGALVAAKKFNGCKDSTSDSEMLRISYATYGTEDANRWTKAGQYGDALTALEKNTYSLISISDVSTDTISVTPYRVGTAWENGACVNQHGAFDSLDNAKKDADAVSKSSKKTYYVYDNTGKSVYTATYTAPKAYIVQAGSFSSKTNANKLVSQLKAKGFDATVKARNGQYVVQCGVFENKSNAEKLVAQIKAKGFSAVMK